MGETISTATEKRAADLAVGDRIAAGFLPDGLPGKVAFTYLYPAHGNVWVFVVPIIDGGPDGVPEPQFFLADSLIPVEPIGAQA